MDLVFIENLIKCSNNFGMKPDKNRIMLENKREKIIGIIRYTDHEPIRFNYFVDIKVEIKTKFCEWAMTGMHM